MAIETVRISAQGREQLSRLKRYTGVEHWNTLCRWALCVSLTEPTHPPEIKQKGEAAIEMSWKTFGGAYAEIYWALLEDRCRRDGMTPNPERLAEQFSLHLHRGLGYLAANRRLRSVSDLISLALKETDRISDASSSAVVQL